MVFVFVLTPWPISKGLNHPIRMSCLLTSMFYACVSLSSSRLCHAWRPQRVCGCVVTTNAHESLFGCNHLGCIAMMSVASCIPFPLFLSVWWYACHACLYHPLAFYASLHACLHVHAWVLLASVSSILQHNETMDIWSKPTFVPRRHHLLFSFLLVCLFACLLAFLLLCLPCLSWLSTLCLFHMLFASISFHCLSTDFLSLPLHVHIWSEAAWS